MKMRMIFLRQSSVVSTVASGNQEMNRTFYLVDDEMNSDLYAEYKKLADVEDKVYLMVV